MMNSEIQLHINRWRAPELKGVEVTVSFLAEFFKCSGVMRVEEQERAYVNWIECPCRIEIVHVVTADTLAVNVAFIFGQTDFVVVFMKCMTEASKHRKHHAHSQK